MKRIVVTGASGAGKSTVSRALARQLGAQWIELDAIHWGPDWTPLDHDTLWSRVDQATRAPAWIIDGSYQALWPLTWGRADTLIWLDLSLPRVMQQVLKRTLKRVFTRERLWAGNQERFRQTLMTRESVIWWAATTWRERRESVQQALAGPDYTHLQVIRLTSRQEVQRFLSNTRTTHSTRIH